MAKKSETTNANTNNVNVNVKIEGKKGARRKGNKSELGKSFSNGFGGELGKKAATLLITVIVILILVYWLNGSQNGDSGQGNVVEDVKVDKQPGKNGNVE